MTLVALLQRYSGNVSQFAFVPVKALPLSTPGGAI
jgi:hypothetical protein